MTLKCASVPFSQIARTGRWDAKFHLARVAHDATVQRLLALPEPQFARLWELAPVQRQALDIVVRGRLPAHSNAAKPPLTCLSREEKAVYLAAVLQDLGRLDREAGSLIAQAAAIRQRRQEIAAIVTPAGDDYVI